MKFALIQSEPALTLPHMLSTPSQSIKDSVFHEMVLVHNSQFTSQHKWKSSSSKREIKDVVTQNTQVLQVLFLDCEIISHLPFIC